MGRCATCEQRIGFFGRLWRKVDGAKHCLKCVPTVMANRRARTMAEISSGREPRFILTLPVLSRDLDYPSNYRRYTGVLVLTDKGVIFAQYGEYKKSQSGAALFGVLCNALDAAVERDRRDAASIGLTNTAGATALAQAQQLFLFKCDDLRKMKCSGSGCELVWGNGWAMFKWLEERKYLKPHRPLLDAYVQAVNRRRDIMGDCSEVLHANE